MHRFVTVAFALFAASAASAETRNLTRFDTVQAEGRFQVEVAIGPVFAVRVDGPDAARIGTRVDDEAVLRIEPLRRPWFSDRRYNATIHVTLPRLEGLVAARGARVNAVAGGECPDFSALAAMGGVLRIEGLACRDIEAGAAMGGELTLSGACRALDATAAMGGEVNAAGLHCRTVEADAVMGGEVSAYAEQSYNASAIMGGDVNVGGGGRVGEREAMMGGDIRERP